MSYKAALLGEKERRGEVGGEKGTGYYEVSHRARKKINKKKNNSKRKWCASFSVPTVQ